MTTRIGSYRIGSEGIAGTFTRASPQATVTGPTSVISSSCTVTWSYSSPIGNTQYAYRVRLQSTGGSTTLFDSGTIVGAGLSYTPAFSLSDQSTYQIVVNVYDMFDVSDDALGTFTVAIAGVGTYPDAAVGSVYEIGINGQGYMLADQPGTEFVYKRTTIPLDAKRYSQGSTPFSEAIDRYSFVAWYDWRGGAGQHFRNREDSDLTSYLDSASMNGFTPGGLQMCKQTVQVGPTATYAIPLATVAGDNLYTQTGAKQLTMTTSGGATTAFTIAAATTITGLASDGTNWYACDGTGVWQGASAVDPGAAWSTIKAQVISWTSGNRLAAGYATTPSTTPNTFTTLKPDGTEDVAAGRLLLQAGTSITSITGGDGYVWFSVRNHQQGLVYAWKAGSTDAPFVAFEFPAGQYPVSLGFYLSNVFVRCAEPLVTGGVQADIYRCATTDGKLIPTLVTQIVSGTDDHSVGGWAGNALYAFFGWKNVESGVSGVGAINLSTGGWSRWLKGSTGGNVRSMVSWNGQLVWTQDSVSSVIEDATIYRTVGSLTTDTGDAGSALSKLYSEMSIECNPLPTGWTVLVEYTLDGGNSFNTTTFSFNTAGTTSLTGFIDRTSQSIGLRITMTYSGSNPVLTPVLKNVSVRFHQVGLADQELTLPINCSDRVTGLNDALIAADSGAGKGAARGRVLENLIQTRVKFQDVDWDADNPVSALWEVETVDLRSVGVYERLRNKQSQTQVAIVTLRRTFK